VLFVDVVNAGAKVGTRLDGQEATGLGLIKNHWTLRAHLTPGYSVNFRELHAGERYTRTVRIPPGEEPPFPVYSTIALPFGKL